MILAVLLVIGSVLLLVANAIFFIQAELSSTMGWVSVFASLFIAAGIWSLKYRVGANKLGRVGIVLISFGVICSAMVMITLLTSGALASLLSHDISYRDIVYTPFFIMAWFFSWSGLAALGLFYWRDQHCILWYGPVICAVALISFSRIIFADIALFHLFHEVCFSAMTLYIGIRMLKTLGGISRFTRLKH